MKYLFYDFHVSHRSFWYLINLVAKVMSVHIFLAKVGAYGLLLKSPPYRSYLSREPCRKSTDTFRGNKILINPENADAKIGK